MKLFRSVFKDHNGVNRLDIFIAKVFLTPASDTFVLAEQEIRGVAGASLSGEFITDFLDLQIDNGSVFKLNDYIHDQQRILICNPCGIVGKYSKNFHVTI